mmetsp:Transcript_114710/g.348985  ORF Transcript_114710/g.348985 Transcript_114710/m.348985 type:complete len:139 (+) Transcript_114710:152-568(+)
MQRLQDHLALWTDNAAEPAESSYALWFAPGQQMATGAWVMRSDSAVDAGKLEEAMRRLVERHPALRARPRETLRLLSFFLDTGILFGLVARLLDRGPWPCRSTARATATSWACSAAAWPACATRAGSTGRRWTPCCWP